MERKNAIKRLLSLSGNMFSETVSNHHKVQETKEFSFITGKSHTFLPGTKAVPE
jgi:hypothetical protein